MSLLALFCPFLRTANLVLTASVPGHCLHFTFLIEMLKNIKRYNKTTNFQTEGIIQNQTAVFLASLIFEPRR